MIGQTLGHYRILEKAGAGGMGVVYRAHDQQLERDVAVKVLPSGTLSSEIVRRHFHKEAMALAKLNHPNIETVYEFGTQDGIDFLVMEYVPGKTLANRLASGSLAEKEVVAFGTQITAALAEAHDRGIVHRDLKPENIAITHKGQAKVLDFGLAKLLHAEKDATTDTLTQAQAPAGTLPYMSPEQLRGESVDARSDIYSIGAVLYEMATSQRAFGGDIPSRIIDNILHQPPVSPRALNRGISAELERIILKCLEKEPDNRFQSAKELEVDLRRLVAPGGAASATSSVPKRRMLARRTFVKAGGALLGAAAIVFIIFGRLTWSNAHTGIPPIQSVAVLPLANLSGDPAQEYFADGMTDELITEMGQVGVLRVISRTSVMQYKGVKRPMPQIARELNVDGVIEGSVERVGDRVRISAQLIYAPTDRHVWSRSYERDMQNVLAMQDDVAQAIVAEIRTNVTPRRQAPAGASRRIDPQAYELYLKGRYFWNKRTDEGLRKGLQYFQESTAKDARDPRGYAGIADSYLMLAEYGTFPAHEAVPKAKAAALKAVELDDSLAEAHASLAALKEDYDWDWSGAEKEFKRSLELNPSYATSHQWYAEFLAEMGRSKEAVDEIARARELDPLSLIVNTVVGEIFYESRQNDQAVQQLRKTLELDPHFAEAHRLLGETYLQLSKHAEAVAELQTALTLSGNSVQNEAFLGQAYGLSGRKNEAKALLDHLKKRSAPVYVSPADLSLVYAGLGDHEQAFRLLDEACKRRLPSMVNLKVDPSLDNLRSDPRFQDLLHQIGFPQ
jgi:eukaryotic-like serine/threonine-protein kinase